MDDRDHADLVNNIRDAIKETWPGFSGDMTRLRTVISQEIYHFRHKRMKKHPIDSFRGQYRFLSNFYEADFEVNGLIYPTLEHYYQSMKSGDFDERVMIQEAKTAGQAKKLGQACTLRPDWDDVKLLIMEDALRQKFSRNPLAMQLANTGRQELIEGNTWNDMYWGMCDGKGENHLGKLLMKIRDEKYSEKLLVAGVS